MPCQTAKRLLMRPVDGCHGGSSIQSTISSFHVSRRLLLTDPSSTDLARRRDQEEKGPFGRPTRRRGSSRSKTATPARKEDVQRLENLQVEDAIFIGYKASQKQKDALVTSKSMPLISLPSNMTTGGTVGDKEATEVILYGYGRDHEWAAIDFYERISGGMILEDYDRHPPNQRYDLSQSVSRAALQRSLSKAALKKRNTYDGGSHWIKVTFDAPEAADLACDRSPHTIQGYLVYAEPYRGTGPPSDAAIPCTNAGAQLDSQSLPATLSTHTLSSQRAVTESPSSSNTLSTATIGQTEPIPMKDLRGASTRPGLSSSDIPGSLQATSSSLESSQHQSQPPRQRTMRIPGATRAVLKSADQALLPSQSRFTGALALIPLLGLVFASGKGETTGSQIPKLEDGSVDWNNAGLYWRFFAWLDALLGTDLCGLRADD